MARYRFIIEVDVSDEDLREYNDQARKRQGVTLPEDPSEWGYFNLNLAISDDIATYLTIETSERLA